MRWSERSLLAAVALFVGWFHLWTVYQSGDPWRFGQEQRDYYNWLIDGWLDGQLHMKVEVPRALLELKDPYDPQLRPPGVGLHDATFYKGKYYVYFGLAPVVLVMLPFRLAAGVDLPLAAAVLVFTYGAFLASTALWLAIRRRYFPNTPAWLNVLLVLALGFAGLGPVLLRRPHMWELPIAGGYCFAMLALGCLFASLHVPAGRRRAVWFGAAGACLGLAIASRPTYLLATPLLLALPLATWWRVERRLPWQTAAWAVVPLACIGSLMALHNYLRFGNPLEFGQAYQLSFDYESKMRHFSPSYVPFNGWRYFFSVADWSWYYPFIQPAELPPKPPGFSGHDDVHGVLTNLPLAWLALAAPLALWRRNAVERLQLGTWLGVATVLFGVMAGVLLCFFGSLARYQVDFTPTLMLLACVGVAGLDRCLSERAVRFPKFVVQALVAVAGVFSCVFGALFSIQLDNRLSERNPSADRAAARLLNRVPALVERLFGVKHGAVEITLRPGATAAGDHTLLTVGEAPREHRLVMRALEGGRVQFRFVPAGAPEIVSRPLAFEPSQTHRLRVTLGALFPPATHPLFSRMAPADVEELTRHVRIDYDGETVIDERRHFASRGGRIRTGTAVAALRRLDAPLRAPAPMGFLRLRLSFPARPVSYREPLIAVAGPEGGALIFAQYLGDTGEIAFGSSVGGQRNVGDAIAIDTGRVHELVARWLPTRDASLQRVELRLNGTIVWSQEIAWRESSGVPVVGRNASGEPGCAAEFTGQLHQVQGSPDGRDPLTSGGDTLRLRVRLPSDRAGAREPLIVTGRTGAGDLLMVEYIDAHTVRFTLDHWGSGPLASALVPLAPARPQDLEITLTSLAPPRDEPQRHVLKGRVAVRVNGVVVWDEAAALYSVGPHEFSVGGNPIGGTSTGPWFTGDLLYVERPARE